MGININDKNVLKSTIGEKQSLTLGDIAKCTGGGKGIGATITRNLNRILTLRKGEGWITKDKIPELLTKMADSAKDVGISLISVNNACNNELNGIKDKFKGKNSSTELNETKNRIKNIAEISKVFSPHIQDKDAAEKTTKTKAEAEKMAAALKSLDLLKKVDPMVLLEASAKHGFQTVLIEDFTNFMRTLENQPFTAKDVNVAYHNFIEIHSSFIKDPSIDAKTLEKFQTYANKKELQSIYLSQNLDGSHIDDKELINHILSTKSKNKMEKLEEFQKFLNQIEPQLGLLGGKYYKHEERNYILNEIVKEFKEIVKSDISSEYDLNLLEDKIKEVIKKINELENKGNEKLNNANFLPKVLTSIRQFFGNLLFDRNKELEKFSFDPVSVTSTHDFKILKLKGDEGTVACKVRGESSKKFPQISKFGTLEFKKRSFLRLRNLTAVRGTQEGARMVGPLDYYGNLERPDKHYYTISIDESGEPQFLAKRKVGEAKPREFKTTVENPTKIDAEWINGKELKKLGKTEDVTFGESLFPNSGVLKIKNANHVELKKIEDPTDVDLSSFKARLVKNDVPFQITSHRLPSSDEYRAVTYHYEGGYDDEQVRSGGGLFLETHTFAQTMTPLFKESRGFVTLGRWVKDEENKLELIGIEIPFGYTLIIDKDCIHGDTNLKGKFLMTMTSDHTTMQKADTVFLKKADDIRKNVSISIAGTQEGPFDDVNYTGVIKIR